MLKRVILVCLFVCSSLSYLKAQLYAINFKLQEHTGFDINPIDSQFDHKAYPVVTADSSNILMMLSTSGEFKAELITSDLQRVSSMTIDLPEIKELQTLIGGFQADSSNFFAIFTNKKQSNFSALSISTQSNTITATQFSMKIKGEKILYSFPSKDRFFIVTMVSNSSMLRIYQLKANEQGEDLDFSRRSYDFSKEDLDETLPQLYKELLNYTVRGNQALSKVPENHTTSVVAASSYFKLYVTPEKVILTLDHVHGRTSIFEMILDSSGKNYQLIRSPEYVVNKPYKYSSNSHIYGDTLIQMIISKEGLSFLMYDRFSQVEIYELSVSKSQIDSFATDFQYRGEAGDPKESPRITTRILKDLNKFQSGLVIKKTEGSMIELAIGTTPSAKSISNNLEKRSLSSTHEVFLQSSAKDITSLSIAFDRSEERPIKARGSTSPFIPVLIAKKSQDIKDPIMETTCYLKGHYYYAWYNVAAQQFVIKKTTAIN